MADVRALMAQERQARRLNHEYASYTKSGMLMCTACQLNIKSEALWEGHLRSANHKSNVKKLHQAQRTVTKRKIDDVDEAEASDDNDARKKLKPKSRTPSEAVVTTLQQKVETNVDQAEQSRVSSELLEPQGEGDGVEQTLPVPQQDQAEPTAPSTVPAARVDEDEWAAFERDVAPLAQPDYSAATITAAPVSAAQLEAEAESDRKRLRDTEAEDEKEDEGRRMEEEFDVMEEMEERVRKLKEQREALRLKDSADTDTGQTGEEPNLTQDQAGAVSDDSDEEEDWYS